MIKIFGKNCIREAIRANQGLQEIFIQEEAYKKDYPFIELLKDKNIKYSLLNKKKAMEPIMRIIKFMEKRL